MFNHLLALVMAASLGACGATPTESFPMSDHYSPKTGFYNPPGSPQRLAGFWEMQRFMWAALVSGRADPVVPPGHVLSHEQAANGWANTKGDKLQWFGHSAFRWQLGKTVLLSDPFLTDRASPLGFAGPKRFAPSPLAPEDATADVIIISHNHYDHLDINTLKRLPNKQTVQVIVPLGVGPLVRSAGIAHVTELDWHQNIKVGDVTVTLLPAVHFSARWLNDRNQTLWGGFMVEGHGKKIYVSGDTTYHPTVFKDIGKRYGPFDYGIVAIGAYEPRRIMIASHVNPEEGVQIGKDIGAKTLIPEHWGAIRLTTEPAFEPPVRYIAAAQKAGYAAADTWQMKIGETRRW
ncbi:MAG TPA: MBL fold metallo-hydrolase [Alphaproteobacteria bacterium]|nr:MBL fold metallo-hydrolase [Alphaproteobacteria bacterium]